MLRQRSTSDAQRVDHAVYHLPAARASADARARLLRSGRADARADGAGGTNVAGTVRDGDPDADKWSNADEEPDSDCDPNHNLDAWSDDRVMLHARPPGAVPVRRASIHTRGMQRLG